MGKTRRTPVDKRTPKPAKQREHSRRCVVCSEAYPVHQMTESPDGLVCEGCGEWL